MLVRNRARRKGRSDIGQGLLGGASPDATILAIHLHPSGTKNWEVTEAVLAWARDVGEGLDELPPEQLKEVLRMVVDEVTVDRDNNLDITLAIPIDDESVSIASQPSPRGGRGRRGGRFANRPYGSGHPQGVPLPGKRPLPPSRVVQGSPLGGTGGGRTPFERADAHRAGGAVRPIASSAATRARPSSPLGRR